MTHTHTHTQINTLATASTLMHLPVLIFFAIYAFYLIPRFDLLEVNPESDLLNYIVVIEFAN